MRPRLLARTHYQADEPAYLRLLVLACSSCSQSEYAERVAGRLVNLLAQRDLQINPAAARYIVDLAHSIRLLNENNVWTDLAILMYTVCRELPDPAAFELTLPERLLFFRLFLEADGAAMIFFGRALQSHKVLPPPGQTWADMANEMFVSCFSEYLGLVGDTAERVALREVIQRRKARPFQGNSGRHQVRVHIQTMYRLRLLIRDEREGSRAYSTPHPQEGFPQGLLALVRALPDAMALETVIEKRAWPEVAVQVFRGDLPCEGTVDGDALARHFLGHVRRTYDTILAAGVSLCPLTSLIESIQIEQLSGLGAAVTYAKALGLLTGLQRQRPREIHFHVDRAGRPAFIKLSEGFAP
jgi:hypothetical protein